MKLKASWRTSILGSGGLVAVVATALTALTDGKPETNPDWGIVIAVAFSSAIGLFSRDNVVTSEEAQAKPPPPGTPPIPTVTPLPDAAIKP